MTATDAVLLNAAAYALDPAATGLSPRRSRLAFALVVAHAGLLLVDHIHFQYNGMLLGAPPCRAFFSRFGEIRGTSRKLIPLAEPSAIRQSQCCSSVLRHSRLSSIATSPLHGHKVRRCRLP